MDYSKYIICIVYPCVLVPNSFLTIESNQSPINTVFIHRFARTVHAKGIIYCDLKPSNVLLDGCGVLKLSDFGLAQQVKEIEASIASRKSGSSASTAGPKRGSPSYMAPELFQGGYYSVYSDLWSLGCVLYELASGSPPFVGQTFETLVEAILNQEVQPLSGCTPEFNDLIRGLLQKRPIDRYGWDVCILHHFSF